MLGVAVISPCSKLLPRHRGQIIPFIRASSPFPFVIYRFTHSIYPLSHSLLLSSSHSFFCFSQLLLLLSLGSSLSNSESPNAAPTSRAPQREKRPIGCQGGSHGRRGRLQDGAPPTHSPHLLPCYTCLLKPSSHAHPSPLTRDPFLYSLTRPLPHSVLSLPPTPNPHNPSSLTVPFSHFIPRTVLPLFQFLLTLSHVRPSPYTSPSPHIPLSLPLAPYRSSVTSHTFTP